MFAGANGAAQSLQRTDTISKQHLELSLANLISTRIASCRG